MDYNVVNAGIGNAYIDSSYFEFKDTKQHTPYIALNVIVLTMEPGKCIPQTLFTTGKETSLKQVFSRNLDYWHAAFPGRPTHDTHALSVYRKSLESIEGYSGKQLHILLLKYEGSKSSRNPNALPLEQFCGTQFFGTLVVALSLTVSPYSLSNFKISDMQILANINRLRGNSKPAPMFSPIPLPAAPMVAPKAPQPVPQPPAVENALPHPILEESFYEMSNDTFFMYRFKTVHCPNIALKHDWNSCLYAHWIYDYRRPPDKFYYIAEMCPLVPPDRGGICKDGDKCGYSHSPLEKLYHPSRYKVSPCESLRKSIGCPRKYSCAFYHTPKEQRNPVTLKTYGPPSQTFLSYAEPRAGCINIVTNYIEVLMCKKSVAAIEAPPLKWKRIALQRPSDTENALGETKSEYAPPAKPRKMEQGPNSVGAPKDYFALFSNEDIWRTQQPSTGVASVASEGVPGKIFIDNQYIDSAEALDVVDDIESDSKMTLICESICSSGSGTTGVKRRELVY